VAPSANQDAPTAISDIDQTWFNTTVDIGPIEFRDDYEDRLHTIAAGPIPP
jgi:hypothetical protein